MESKYRTCPLCSGKEADKLHFLKGISIVRCDACRMVYADCDNDFIYEKNHYSEKEFQRYVQSEPKYALQYYDSLISRIAALSPTRIGLKILDFGCGPGLFLKRAQKAGVDAYGLDFSDYSRTAAEILRLSIRIEDVFETGYRPGQFDAIVTHATHEHIGNVFQVSEKLTELLKPGGLLVISGVPNYNSFSRLLFNNFHNNMPPAHVNFFEKHSLRQLYTRLNLNVLSLKSYGMDIWWLYRRLKPKQAREVANSANRKLSTQTVNSRLEIDFGWKDRLITSTYIHCIVPGTGQSLEAIGRKP